MEYASISFGKIEYCILVDYKTHKTYGFIDFESDKVVPVAITAMNGFEVGGDNLHVITAMIPGTLIEGMKASKGCTMIKGQSMAISPVEPLNSVLGEEHISIKEAARVAHDRAQKNDNRTATVVRIANAVTAGEADDALSEEFEEECRRLMS
ncbi:hypothetical protein BDF22DRAFT_742312 [Syncephalis plumigaleata]|nr:hypothetical protein BDF22DRAFT_742312 [Syncephalis plumigaleata]